MHLPPPGPSNVIQRTPSAFTGHWTDWILVTVLMACGVFVALALGIGGVQ